LIPVTSVTARFNSPTTKGKVREKNAEKFARGELNRAVFCRRTAKATSIIAMGSQIGTTYEFSCEIPQNTSA